MLRVPILPLLLSLSLSIASAFAQEVPVSSVEFGPAYDNRDVAAVAASDDTALIVWNESGVTQFGGPGSTVFATRITPSGSVLDPRGLKISSGDGYARAAGWTGKVFVVGWSGSSRAYVTAVASDGTVLRETALEGWTINSIACQSGRCLVTFTSFRAGAPTLDVAVIDADGRLLSSPETVAQVPGGASAVSATDGTGFALAWSTADSSAPWRQRLHVAAVSRDGRPGSVTTIPTTTSVGGLLIAGDPDGYLVGWSEGGQTAFQRIAGDGRLAGSPTRTFIDGLAGMTTIALVPRIGGYVGFGRAAATQHLISFSLAPLGDALGKPTALSVEPSSTFVLVPFGGKVLIASTEGVVGRDVFARFATASGETVGERIPLVISARPQSAPAAAADGDRLLTAWVETPNDKPQIRMSIVRGTSRELEQWVAPSQTGQSAPKVVFSGSEYLIVWHEGTIGNGALFGRRFTRAGVAIDAAPVLLAQRPCWDWTRGTLSYAIASNGDSFLLAWSDCAREVVTEIAAGAPMATQVIGVGKLGAELLDLAWNGTNYVLLWLDHVEMYLCSPGPCYGSEVRASILSRSGTPTNPDGVLIGPGGHARVAATGIGEVLITWLNRDYEFIGVRMNKDGSLAGRATLLPGTSVRSASLVRVGMQMLLSVTTDRAIRGVLFSPNEFGAGAPPARFDLVQTPPTAFAGAAIVARTGGEVSIVYQRQVDDPEYGRARRLFIRTVSFVRQRAVRR